MRKRRCLSLVLLTTFIVGQFANPITVLALSGGPNQPEYGSYESPSSKDMVSLFTGDMNVNIPLMNVPMPNGYFPINTFYHSGVSMDDEASWVGLGWNLNAGSISRSVIGYPDDYKDQVGLMYAKSYEGSVLSENYVFFNRTWDSNRGFSGGISLLGLVTVGFNDDGVTDGSVIGIGYNGTKMTFDVDNFANGIMTVGSLAMTIGSAGVAAPVALGITLGAQTAASFVALGLQQGSLGGVGAIRYEDKKIDWFTHRTTFWSLYRQQEHAFGALYLGQMEKAAINSAGRSDCNASYCTRPGDTELRIYADQSQNYYDKAYLQYKYFNLNGSGEKVASDIDITMTSDDYTQNFAPVNLAYDNYMVSGSEVYGYIAPFRMDIGSVITPKYNSPYNNLSFYTLPYLDEISDNYKVQFKYLGMPSSSATHHFSSGTLGASIGRYEKAANTAYYFAELSAETKAVNSYLKNGTTAKKLVTGRDVEWYSNAEILNGTAVTNGFVDFTNSTNRTTSRSGMPLDGIGGFSITTESGMTYHYSVPVYNTGALSYSDQTIGEMDNETTKKYSYFADAHIENGAGVNNKYAVSWLLTAITGPDFVDRGEVGFIGDSDNDYGYWVKFEYGKFAGDYIYRAPFTDYYRSKTSADVQVQIGSKETYYLNTIRTKTHTALFIKDIRNDYRSWYGPFNGTFIYGFEKANESSSLSLEEIILLTNEDYASLITSGLSTTTSNSQDEILLKTSVSGCSAKSVYDVRDITTSLRTLINDRQLSKVAFVQDYSRCPSTDNSYATVSTTGTKTGKLTLNKIQFLGKNNIKITPDYEFTYFPSNPTYNRYSVDAWGGYNAQSTTYMTVGGAPNSTVNNLDHTAWMLKSIKSPLGSTVEFDISRDVYEDVGGVATSPKPGGDIRVNTITAKDELGNAYKTKYIYEKGSVAQEPASIRTVNNGFAEKYGKYPTTSVCYGQTSILKGNLSTDLDFESKTVYQFRTPKFEDINYSRSDQVVNRMTGAACNVNDNTSKIGSVLSILEYNKTGHEVQSNSFTYANNAFNGTGIFKESTILSEYASNTGDIIQSRRFIKTNYTKYPNILSSVVSNTTNGTTTKTINDINTITGIPTKTTVTNQLGVSYTTQTIPAYLIYNEMGPKATNKDNKNMLTQPFLSYVYLNNNTAKVVSATAQSWSKNWLYGELGTYGYAYQALAGEKSYRVGATYVWKENAVATDGTFSLPSAATTVSTETNMINCTNCKWQKGSEPTQYDHFSRVLETKDINNNLSSTKYGYNERYPISSATFSGHRSFFHTGFEYLDKSNEYGQGWFFDKAGEVWINDAISLQVSSSIQGSTTIKPHSGSYMCRSAGYYPNSIVAQYLDKPQSTTYPKGIEMGRTYRMSAWIHSLSDPQSALVCILGKPNNGTLTYTKKISDAGAVKATVNGWSLVTMDVTFPATVGDVTDVSFSLRAGTPNAYFDDFRVHPIESDILATTYDRFGRVEYTLNKQNYFTKYVYNDKNQLVEVHQETPDKGIKKVKQYKYHQQGEPLN